MSSQQDADDAREAEILKFIEQVMRYQDGTLGSDELAELASEIGQNQAKRSKFIELQLQSALVHEILRRQAYQVANRAEEDCSAKGRFSVASLKRWGVLSAACMALLAIWLLSQRESPVAVPVAATDRVEEVPQDVPVLLAEASQAGFIGPASVATGDSLARHQDYMLVSGLVKLAFPRGATAILEAPAKFHILNSDSLALEVGSCSVHAPEGAEGFRVVTPATDIVDRGTRFSVKVNEISETEVHVIEGVADLFPLEDAGEQVIVEKTGFDDPDRMEKIRLTERQARRLDSIGIPLGQPAPFNPSTYRRQLPDRIISYQATRTDKGHAEELLDVTVQREGRRYTYSAEELIPIKVTWFKGDESPDRYGHLIGERTRPQRPQDWLEDRKLNTGLANFGGQPDPPEQAPVMEQLANGEADGTPGLGIRFRSPVVNGPGPDIVLFEVQCITNPLEGDPFHVTPAVFRQGLKAATIRVFDLTLASPETLEVNEFWLHRFPERVHSLAALATQSSEFNRRLSWAGFRANAVGIDLSDMGFAEGEHVEELFLQHASPEGKSKVDPVFIAGFPDVPLDQSKETVNQIRAGHEESMD